MKKQNPLILNIPNPCNESWADMSVVERGRFCSHCQKTVTDITAMSDAQIVQLFQKQTDTHCIRAFASQLNRPITLPPQTPTPTRFYRIAVALGLVLITAGASEVYARPRAPLTEQNDLLTTTEDSSSKVKKTGDTLEIYGVVLDENGDLFPGAVLKLTQGGILKGGTMTEDDGSFSIKPIISGDYNLEVYAQSYSKQMIIISEVELNKNRALKIKMQPDNNSRSFEMGFIISRPPIIAPGQKTFYDNDLKKLGF